MMKPVKIVLSTAILLIAVLPAATLANLIEVEAETFVGHGNIGRDPIVPIYDYLYGLDTPGEWVSYPLFVDVPGTYTSRVLARGDRNYTCVLQIVVDGSAPGDEQTDEISFEGTGMT